MPNRLRYLAPALAAVLTTATACADNDGDSGSADAPKGATTVTVTSTDDACKLSTDTAPSGPLVFKVRNDGSEVTEFYLYAEDGEKVLSEVEDIGPGLSRNMVVDVDPGTYVTACKPGMSGDGIRDKFTVTDSGKNSAARPAAYQGTLDDAGEEYAAYVRSETRQLLDGTRRFVAAYQAGRDAEARDLYPEARVHWERIEPVAESFGDLDPKMDARQADLSAGQEWTGWHRLEKDLWPPKNYQPLTHQQRVRYADQLLADTVELSHRVQKLDVDAYQIANGAKELMDEVATGKVTGEEEVWSHTDLYDFQANVDGARKAFEVLEPAVQTKDPQLAETIEERFADLQKLLDRYRSDDGFVSYTELGNAQVRELSDAVNAVAEPLSRLTATVTL
jgi:iron uptake system component EfeO